MAKIHERDGKESSTHSSRFHQYGDKTANESDSDDDGDNEPISPTDSAMSSPASGKASFLNLDETLRRIYNEQNCTGGSANGSPNMPGRSEKSSPRGPSEDGDDSDSDSDDDSSWSRQNTNLQGPPMMNPATPSLASPAKSHEQSPRSSTSHPPPQQLEDLQLQFKEAMSSLENKGRQRNTEMGRE